MHQRPSPGCQRRPDRTAELPVLAVAGLIEHVLAILGGGDPDAALREPFLEVIEGAALLPRLPHPVGDALRETGLSCRSSLGFMRHRPKVGPPRTLLRKVGQVPNLPKPFDLTLIKRLRLVDSLGDFPLLEPPSQLGELPAAVREPIRVGGVEADEPVPGVVRERESISIPSSRQILVKYAAS